MCNVVKTLSGSAPIDIKLPVLRTLDECIKVSLPLVEWAGQSLSGWAHGNTVKDKHDRPELDG
jgi:hypothetical protein